MASIIKTYKERPECAVPDCTNESFIHMGGQWICGLCCKRLYDKQNKEVFKQIVQAKKEEENENK